MFDDKENCDNTNTLTNEKREKCIDFLLFEVIQQY